MDFIKTVIDCHLSPPPTHKHVIFYQSNYWLQAKYEDSFCSPDGGVCGSPKCVDIYIDGPEGNGPSGIISISTEYLYQWNIYINGPEGNGPTGKYFFNRISISIDYLSTINGPEGKGPSGKYLYQQNININGIYINYQRTRG